VAGYVLDTTAVMAVILQEPGAEQVREAIYSPDRVRLPFLVLMEVEYKLLQIKPEIVDEALSLIDNWPVQLVESYFSWRREAAQVKAKGKLSFADAWVASLALLTDAELVHKDPEFDGVDGLNALRLPYDRDLRDVR
jgi:predicted nucleic acid-binding protein